MSLQFEWDTVKEKKNLSVRTATRKEREAYYGY